MFDTEYIPLNPEEPKKPKIYLAGPTCFSPDHEKLYAELKDICKEFGCQGVSPMDNEIKNLQGQALAKAIYQANVDLIDSCDGVLACMNPFRGPSMDVGTTFEMGYAAAQKKPIVGYITPVQPEYAQRVKNSPYGNKTLTHCSRGWTLEQFGGGDTLMVWHSPKNIYQGDYRAVRIAIARLAYLLTGEVNSEFLND